MPIKSKAQWRKLAMDEPAIFKRFLDEYPDTKFKNLPEKVKKKASKKVSKK